MGTYRHNTQHRHDMKLIGFLHNTTLHQDDIYLQHARGHSGAVPSCLRSRANANHFHRRPTTTTTTPPRQSTPRLPTQPLLRLANLHQHNAPLSNTTPRSPTRLLPLPQLLHQRPLNQHNASLTYMFTTTTTTTTSSSRFRFRTRAGTPPATHLSAEGQQTARRKFPLSLPISARTTIHFHHTMFSIRSHPDAPLRFPGRSARHSFGKP